MLVPDSELERADSEGTSVDFAALVNGDDGLDNLGARNRLTRLYGRDRSRG